MLRCRSMLLDFWIYIIRIPTEISKHHTLIAINSTPPFPQPPCITFTIHSMFTFDDPELIVNLQRLLQRYFNTDCDESRGFSTLVV